MKVSRFATRPLHALAIASLALGPVVACASPVEETSDPVRATREPFSTALAGEANHEAITQSALSFLRPDILGIVTAANVSVDVEFVLVNAHHFDDCNFSGGAGVIRGFQRDAVSALAATASAESDAAAALAFGRWLHTVQDFYSHSNWVESGGQGLVESSLDAWPAWTPYATLPGSGFVLVEGATPKNVSVTRKTDEPYPTNAIVRVKSSKQQAKGLMTGTVDYEPGNLCPPSIAMAHDDLNKDKSDTAGREAGFVSARAAAVDQTRHEWCRLVAMTKAADGDAGVARLMTWTTDPAASACR